ncbi:MAG: hypothetical protein GC206_13310 [Alphaproteobacteria bacterium]|nr:hypothetical protein [Alphaproteobacteria bacterium]
MSGFFSVFGAFSTPQALPPPVEIVAPPAIEEAAADNEAAEIAFEPPPPRIEPRLATLSRAAAAYEGQRAFGVSAEEAMAAALSAFVDGAEAQSARADRVASRKTFRKFRALVDAHAQPDLFE